MTGSHLDGVPHGGNFDDAAVVEVHIEQGPVLLRGDRPVAW